MAYASVIIVPIVWLSLLCCCTTAPVDSAPAAAPQNNETDSSGVNSTAVVPTLVPAGPKVVFPKIVTKSPLTETDKANSTTLATTTLVNSNSKTVGAPFPTPKKENAGEKKESVDKNLIHSPEESPNLPKPLLESDSNPPNSPLMVSAQLDNQGSSSMTLFFIFVILSIMAYVYRKKIMVLISRRSGSRRPNIRYRRLSTGETASATLD